MMKKVLLRFIISLFIIGNSAFAQWSGTGSTNLTGPIYRTGNVGVGTTSDYVPFKLTLGLSSQNDGLLLSETGGKCIALLNNMTSGAWNSLTQPGDNMLMWKGGSNPDQADAGGLVIAPWSNSNNGIRISPQGNVGIGTSNSGSFKLAVEGKIAAREIQVTLQSPFPDYVFASNYKLRSLYNLESYINQNKHLPGIPSATEVEKKGGIELGQMNTKLLEKIEELTLYVIELNKKIEKLEKEKEASTGK
jgi:hypothetical protein